MGNRIKRKFFTKCKTKWKYMDTERKKEQIFHDGYIFLKMETMSPY